MKTGNESNRGYLLLFRGKDWDAGLSSEELQAILDRFEKWSDSLAKSGKVRGGQALAREGKSLSGEKGRTVTDGPFPESKESIGGYLLIDADGIEEALEFAKACPGLDYGGTIELRPVLDECPVFKRARERLELVSP